jgi:chromosome segregation ATPase
MQMAADLKARLAKLKRDRKVLTKQVKAATDALAEVETDIEATQVEISKLTAVSASLKGKPRKAVAK